MVFIIHYEKNYNIPKTYLNPLFHNKQKNIFNLKCYLIYIKSDLPLGSRITLNNLRWNSLK